MAREGVNLLDIKIYTKNLELNPQAQEYIQKKFDRLQRHFKSIADAKLEVHRTSDRSQSNRVIAQMTLMANGYTLRGQDSGLNLFAAIDAVTDVMDRQIQKFKGKVYRSARAKRSARASATGEAVASAVDVGSALEETTDSELGRVVRTKRFPMNPMTVEDAILEMELLGHSFFLFYNIDSSQFNVLYRRHDGDYGVLEPELA